MKRQIAAIVALIIMLTASAAYAQTNQIIKANIPFSFETQNKTLPAGEYILRRSGDKNTEWVIAGKSVKDPSVSLITKSSAGVSRTSKTKLTFRRYGSRHFLVEFTTSAYQITLPKSKAERSLQRQFELNNKLAKAEIVTVEIALE